MLDLGVPDGCTGTEGTHLNDHGQVIVSARCDNYPYSNSCYCGKHLWENGEFWDLGELDPISINNRGQILGRVGGLAAVWEAGSVTTIGEPQWYRSWAHDINDAGQVVGEYRSNPGAQSRCFIWKDGETTVFTLADPTRNCSLRRINENGVVVGGGFVWEDGLVRDLAGPEGLDLAGAKWINDHGQLVGSASSSTSPDSGNGSHAVLWEKQEPDPD